MKYYTGIGSRETPDHIQTDMFILAGESFGWTLRSGAADFEAAIVGLVIFGVLAYFLGVVITAEMGLS
jgi:hypothetical protein